MQEAHKVLQMGLELMQLLMNLEDLQSIRLEIYILARMPIVFVKSHLQEL